MDASDPSLDRAPFTLGADTPNGLDQLLPRCRYTVVEVPHECCLKRAFFRAEGVGHLQFGFPIPRPAVLHATRLCRTPSSDRIDSDPPARQAHCFRDVLGYRIQRAELAHG